MPLGAGSWTEIFDEVKKATGNRSGMDDRIWRWINYGYREFLQTPYFEFTELDRDYNYTTDSSTTEINISLEDREIWYILWVYDETSARMLRQRSYKDLVKNQSTTRSQCLWWARELNYLALDPKPDGAYVLNIRYRMAVGNPDPDSYIGTRIGPEWNDLIVMISKVKAYQGLEQPDKAAKMRAAYDLEVTRRRDISTLEDNDDLERTIGVRLGDV